MRLLGTVGPLFDFASAIAFRLGIKSHGNSGVSARAVQVVDAGSSGATVETPFEGLLDDQTWRDLELERFVVLALPNGSGPAKRRAAFELRRHDFRPVDERGPKSIRGYLHSVDARTAVRNALGALQNAPPDLTERVREYSPPPRHKWEQAVKWIPLLLPLGIISSVLAPIGVLVFASYVVAVFVCQTRLYAEELYGQELEKGLISILHSIEAVGALPDSGLDACLSEVRNELPNAKYLLAALSRSRLLHGLPEAQEYCNWLFLLNLRHYLKFKDLIAGHKPYICRQLDLLVGLEVQVALAEFLSTRSDICWVTPSAEPRVSFVDVVHPLLVDAVPISLSLESKGLVITGENASGKSTVLRTLGLNVVCAQTFGFCFARSATVSFGGVYSSINMVDDMASGKSLFVAEMNRAKLMFDSAARMRGALFLFDELFRGTNHVESVAVAFCYLKAFVGENFIVATTHNLELAGLLEGHFCRYQARRVEGMISRYFLEGESDDRINGIRIFEAAGFDQRLVELAVAVAGLMRDAGRTVVKSLRPEVERLAELALADARDSTNPETWFIP